MADAINSGLKPKQRAVQQRGMLATIAAAITEIPRGLLGDWRENGPDKAQLFEGLMINQSILRAIGASTSGINIE
jgi:hypothetical protein